jgi:hypothetical protein
VLDDLPVAARHAELAHERGLAREHADAPAELGRQEFLRQQEVSRQLLPVEPFAANLAARQIQAARGGRTARVKPPQEIGPASILARRRAASILAPEGKKIEQAVVFGELGKLALGDRLVEKWWSIIKVVYIQTRAG